MKTALIVIALFFLPTAANAQVYKCKMGNTTVIQDAPCPSSAQSSTVITADRPTKPIDVQVHREKLDQDKAYLDERVKARIQAREKDAAQQDINRCDAQAANLLNQVNKLATSAPSGQPINLASAAAMQLDQQRRQTQIQSLQSQHSAKLAQCAQMRQSFKDKYGP